MNEFTLRLADGRWVSSPTNTVTSNPNLAGVFTAADHKSAADLRRKMERIHGPLELVPWQSKRTHGAENVGLLAEAQDLFAGEMLQSHKDALHDMQIDGSEVVREIGLKAPPLITFPARPIQGGRLELAPPKRGLWYAEPKLNGWCAHSHADRDDVEPAWGTAHDCRLLPTRTRRAGEALQSRPCLGRL